MNLKKNTIQLLIANFIQLLFGLFQIVFFARLIAEKHDFGQLQQINLIASLLVASAGAIPNSINYFFGFYGPGNYDHSMLIRRFFFNSSALAILISLTLWCFHIPLAHAFSNNLLLTDIYWVSTLVFLRLANLLYQNICLIKGRLKYLTTVHILQLILLCTVFLLRNTSGYVSVTTLLQILVGAELLKTIPLLFITRKDLLAGPFRLSHIKLLPAEWKYSSYLLLNGILIAITSQADRLIVSSFSDPVTYSDYSLGTFANPLIGVVLASVTTTFIPVLSALYASNDFPAILKVWKRTSQTGVVLILPLVLFTIFFGDDVIVFLFSPRYQSAALLFQLFNIKFLLVFVVFTITMNAIGLEKYTLINSFINLVTGCLLVIAGLKTYGATGAVCGSIVAIYLGYIFPVTLINRRLNCSFSDYFPVRTFLLTIGLSVFIGILVLFVKKIFTLSPYIIIFMVAPLYYVSCFMLLNKYVSEVVSISKLKSRFFS